ncbi:MAG: ATP-binding protein [Thermodesulfobacteriota bacterium]|nr:ATP-binding protein [Thermodesulfobacteriota bacterium]
MTKNNRILIVDDDPGVRESYCEILSPGIQEDVLAAGAALFEDVASRTLTPDRKKYDLSLTEKGELGVEAVERAVNGRKPFAVAFVDMKMPGINGAETSKRIWAIDPRVKIIIVTAFSEYSPDDIIDITGREDIFYLRKPFNPEEIRQFARALTNEWDLEREKEHLQGELEDMNKNLQKKVEEQTALLIQSEKMASIGILAAGVAHEINNPISFVNGNLNALKKYSVRISDILRMYVKMEISMEQGMTDEMPSFLREIKALKEKYKLDFIMEDMVNLVEESMEGTGRVRDIVQDLKTFSRIDQAELKYINLNEAIDSTINIIRNEIKYNAEIIKHYGILPEVKCFPQKTSQVFMNILMNAAQAIEDKGTIKIETIHIQDGRRETDRRVQIRISDTGKGIPEKELSKIFDPFFTTKPVGQGTGLGLSITYDIITAHNWKITVDSEEGSGTTFTIDIPLEVNT